MSRVALILFLIFFYFFSLGAEEISFNSLYDEYKKGNFETVSRLSRKALNSANQDSDPRFFFLYVSTEKNWESLRSVVTKIEHPSWKLSKHFWNGIFIFMERALVLGENEILVDYGMKFQKEGKANLHYNDSIFFLAFGLNELKNGKEALRVLDELELSPLTTRLQNQIKELRSEIKNEKIN